MALYFRKNEMSTKKSSLFMYKWTPVPTAKRYVCLRTSPDVSDWSIRDRTKDNKNGWSFQPKEVVSWPYI